MYVDAVQVPERRAVLALHLAVEVVGARQDLAVGIPANLQDGRLRGFGFELIVDSELLEELARVRGDLKTRAYL